MLEAQRAGQRDNDPAEHVERGLQTLAELVANGDRLDEPRLSSHAFSGPPEQLESLSYALRQVGYTIDSMEGRTLSAHVYAPVDEPWLREAMVILCRVADTFEVTYDGWTATTDPKQVN